MPRDQLDTDDEARWHLDKRVPISIICVLVGQMTLGIWFASKLDSRVGALEEAKTVQHERDDKQDRSTADAISALRTDIRDVSAKLDRLIERAGEKR